MELSEQEARESLSLIQDATARTRKVVAAGYASDLLILWGLIYMAGFTAVYFAPRQGGILFAVLDGVGLLGTLFIAWRAWPTHGSLRGASTSRVVRGIFLFWLILFAYAGLWLLMLRPMAGMQVGALLVTVAMLGYIVTGLWTASTFLVWLGLAVTALTLFGFYVIPGYFNLWMAPTGGGALLGTGLYVRIRWR
ncbi:MAG: hypothetical protein JW955_03495 [Sedimentisphaerales bacterium]|nr:hypothetical protein [Sedimentisphaerales bacterium]